jgi:TM2 domain-containing membrane protein YozV
MSSNLADNEVYCRDCGSVINARAEICPECGIRQQDPDSDTDSASGDDKDPGIAAIASFVIPGLGQVYNGQIAKGFILGVVVVALVLTGIGLLLAIPIWLWLVYDAYSTAEDLNGDSSTQDAPLWLYTGVNDALDRYEEEYGDSEELEEVRTTFRERSVENLPDEHREFIIETVEWYDQSTSRDLSPVLEELRQTSTDR